MQLGLTFLDPEQQQILAISERPRYPRSSGHPRVATSEDTTLFVDWMIEFCREAVPNDPPPEREALERAPGDDSCLFWVDNGQPVSMARMVRPLKKSAAISGVYTRLTAEAVAMPARSPRPWWNASVHSAKQPLVFTSI